VNKECIFLFSRGIKVYPIFKNNCWFIEWDDKGKVNFFNKAITQKEINISLAKSIQYLYKKQLENEQKSK
jgi:hypothetical protein